MRTIHTIAIASLMAASLFTMAPARANTTERLVANAVHSTIPMNQQADEITRRLRRMGFEYIHVQNGRPKEMVGEIC